VDQPGRWLDDREPSTLGNDPDAVAAGDLVAYTHGNDRYGWTTSWDSAATGDGVPGPGFLGRGLSVRGDRAAGVNVFFGLVLTGEVRVANLTSGAADWSGTLWQLTVGQAPQPNGITLGTTQLFYAGSGLLSNAPGAGTLGNGLRAFRATGATSTCGPAGEPYYACPLWVPLLDGTGATPPVLSSDEATAYTVSDVGTVYAIDTATGAVRWSGSTGSAVAEPPALAQGSLFVPTASGALVVFDADGCGAATCAARWSTPTGSALTVQPAVAGGVVFTGADDGTLQAFAADGCGAATCSASWSEALGSSITGAPAISLGKLFVGTEDGRLIAYAPR